MQSQSHARRHFYCAFYNWAYLNTGPRLPSYAARSAYFGHPFHSSSRVRNETGPNIPSQTLAQDVDVRKPFGERLKPKRPQDRPDRIPEKAKIHEPHWINAAAETSAEFPFNRILAWDAAVRYRAESRIVVEFAIPVRDFQSLQNQYGADLSKLAAQIGARIELGYIGVVGGNQSLLMSGTIDEGRRLDKLLRSSSDVQPPVKSEAPEKTARRESLRSSWLAQFLMRDDTQLPSSSIEPWSFVIRRGPDSPTLTMETVLPAGIVDDNKDRIYEAAKGKKVAASFSPQFRVDGLGMMRSCTFTGVIDRVQLFHAWFRSFRDSQIGQQAHVDIPHELQNLFRFDSSKFRRFIAKKAKLSLVPTYIENFNGSGKSVLCLQCEPGRLAAATEIVQAELAKHMVNNSNSDQQLDLAERTRSIFRAVTHPVVVIASSGSPPEDGTATLPFQNCRGVTVSSFNTVTLEPSPIVSFNLRLPSRSWDAIFKSKIFRVHILQASAQGAAIAHAFTTPYDHAAEPFARLHNGGATITEYQGEDADPPEIKWGGAVLATLKARLLISKCIYVNDHVIAIAQINESTVNSESDGTMEQAEVLAYARRRYRDLGETIDPDKFKLNEESVELDKSSPTPSENEPVPTHSHESGTTSQQTEIVASRTTTPTIVPDNGSTLSEVDQSSVDSSVALDISTTTSEQQLNVVSQHPKDLVEQQEKSIMVESPVLEIDQPREASPPIPISEGDRVSTRIIAEEQSPNPSIDQKVIDDQQQQQPVTPQPSNEVAAPPDQTNPQQTATLSPSGPLGTTNKRPEPTRPWGLSSYSTLSRPKPDKNRSFATKTSKTKRPPRKGLSEAMLKTTVAEFLSEDPDVFVRPERIRDLLRIQGEGFRASKELQRAAAAGTLTDEDSVRLEGIIRTSKQTIAKSLAVRAAKDLRRMLDRGWVDVERAQWMESAIEEGQAVMLEEARQVRQAATDGKMSKEEFDEIRKKMEVDFELLKTEAMRLRAMTDDDENQGS